MFANPPFPPLGKVEPKRDIFSDDFKSCFLLMLSAIYFGSTFSKGGKGGILYINKLYNDIAEY